MLRFYLLLFKIRQSFLFYFLLIFISISRLCVSVILLIHHLYFLTFLDLHKAILFNLHKQDRSLLFHSFLQKAYFSVETWFPHVAVLKIYFKWSMLLQVANQMEMPKNMQAFLTIYFITSFISFLILKAFPTNIFRLRNPFCSPYCDRYFSMWWAVKLA